MKSAFNRALFVVIQGINRDFGRGDVRNLVPTDTGGGLVERWVPTSQRAGFWEQRRYTVLRGAANRPVRVRYLGRVRKVTTK